jgi:hypothetical protein
LGRKAGTSIPGLRINYAENRGFALAEGWPPTNRERPRHCAPGRVRGCRIKDSQVLGELGPL